jgi:hypothetical protein
VDAGEPAEGSSFNDIGLMCDAAAQGLGIALVRLKLGQPWLDNGTLERMSNRAMCPAPMPITCAGAPAPWTAGNARPLPTGCAKACSERGRGTANSRGAEKIFIPLIARLGLQCKA